MGILSSNVTLDINDSASNGVVILDPSPSDTSTATINRLQSGTSRIRTLGPSGYATVNLANQLKLGNADLDIGGNTFMMALIRIPSFEALTGSTDYWKIFESTQLTSTSVPKFALTVRGKGQASLPRLIVAETETQAGTGTRTQCTFATSNNANTPFDSSMTPWGNTLHRPRPYTGWIWVGFVRNTSGANAQVGPYLTVNSGSNLCSNNQMTMFYNFANDSIDKVSHLNIAPAQTTRISLTGGGTAGLVSITGLDFAIGCTAANSLDIARLVKMDSLPLPMVMHSLMRGGSLADNNVTENAQNFVIDFTSAAIAGAKITTLSGAPVWNTSATDGPMLHREVGTVTYPTALTANIANDKANP